MRNFIGYDQLIKNFKNRCSSNTLSHAHLIAGEDGIGKSILAKILSVFILNGILDREYVDFINYKPKKASFGVDEVREVIDEVYKKPFEGDKKVIIIHDGNKLTVQAQNALLKTIEEPPSGVYIILLCESLELILDTIKSRCDIYKLTPLTREQLKLYIKNKGYDYGDLEVNAAIAFSEGIPGRIDRYFEDEKLKELRDKIITLFYAINKNDIELVIQKEEEFISYKDNKEDVLNIISLLIRDILLHKEIDNNDILINSDKISDISEFTKEMSFKKLNGMITKVEDARKNIKSNVTWPMILRVMFMGFMEV